LFNVVYSVNSVYAVTKRIRQENNRNLSFFVFWYFLR